MDKMLGINMKNGSPDINLFYDDFSRLFKWEQFFATDIGNKKYS